MKPPAKENSALASARQQSQTGVADDENLTSVTETILERGESKPYSASRRKTYVIIKCCLAAILACSVLSFTAAAQGLDTAKIDSQLGRSGQKSGDVYRVGFPRTDRSEERRVGKECRSRWSPYH